MSPLRFLKSVEFYFMSLSVLSARISVCHEACTWRPRKGSYAVYTRTLFNPATPLCEAFFPLCVVCAYVCVWVQVYTLSDWRSTAGVLFYFIFTSRSGLSLKLELLAGPPCPHAGLTVAHGGTQGLALRLHPLSNSMATTQRHLSDV